MESASRIQSCAIPSIDFSCLAGLLSCPDDGSQLVCTRSSIECHSCRRRFLISDDGVADLLPLRSKGIPDTRNPVYWHEYAQEFRRPYVPKPNSIAWGAPEVWDTSWVRKRFRQVHAVRPLIADSQFSKSHVFCDIAAGAGNYTLSYASAFRIVLHCDLSADNLSYAARKAKRLGIRNVFFLRVDYFSLPFTNVLDRVVCFDTLIRGEQHEIALLGSVRKAMKPDARAVVDFHNWWHNPLRRLGLLPQNFGENRSYKRKAAECVLQAAGIHKFEFFPFYQEFDADSKGIRIAAVILRPTRLLFRFQGAVTGAVRTAASLRPALEEFHVA